MTVLVFFGIVILFSFMLVVVEKVRAFNSKEGSSLSFDGDSVKVKSKKANGKRSEYKQLSVKSKRESKVAC